MDYGQTQSSASDPYGMTRYLNQMGGGSGPMTGSMGGARSTTAMPSASQGFAGMNTGARAAVLGNRHYNTGTGASPVSMMGNYRPGIQPMRDAMGNVQTGLARAPGYNPAADPANGGRYVSMDQFRGRNINQPMMNGRPVAGAGYNVGPNRINGDAATRQFFAARNAYLHPNRGMGWTGSTGGY